MSDILANLYPWVKSLHLISVVSWMAGLFYLPRLFVYHVEKASDNAELSKIYQEMELKLFRVIMNPAMIATWVFGLMLVFTPGIVDWSTGWPWMKATMVLLLTWFHHWLGWRRKDFLNGTNTTSGRSYRLMNEVPTLCLIVIVIMVIVKPF